MYILYMVENAYCPYYILSTNLMYPFTLLVTGIISGRRKYILTSNEQHVSIIHSGLQGQLKKELF